MIARGLFAAASVATSVMAFACGHEEFLPAVTEEYAPVTDRDNVVVLDNTDEDTAGYSKIGTAMIVTKNPLAAVKGCRQMAADRGGDAILQPKGGGKEWRCTIMRSKGNHALGPQHTKAEPCEADYQCSNGCDSSSGRCKP